ncbi:50S ribosomal protein L25 [Clostridiisalibacter paucivorans]|uniref:50S ribosomal protein L25 n=1 Tax=Clostridiisalibacter paucivorans TaxID=408753 RepID=UPI00047D3BFF|nr:50S ribosomal protein L25 [Clostridiisalibacter paucivorans]
MAAPKLKANIREVNGTTNAKKLRNSGFTPAVLYSGGAETKNIELQTKVLNKVIQEHGNGAMVSIELGGSFLPAIIKEIQRDVVKEKLLHVDFQQLSENVKVKLTIPIVLENKEKVEDNTTIVQQQLMDIELQCLPKYIPSAIYVDANMLKKENSITIGNLDIFKDENIEVLNDEQEIIATLTYASMGESEEEDESLYESDKSILDM